MNNQTAKKMGELRGRKKDKSMIKLSKRKVRYEAKAEVKAEDKHSWWNFQSEDEQIWLMMKYGWDTPFNPNRVRYEEMEKMYDLEKKQS